MNLPNALNINLNPNANTNVSGNPNGVVKSVITVIGFERQRSYSQRDDVHCSGLFEGSQHNFATS